MSFGGYFTFSRIFIQWPGTLIRESIDALPAAIGLLPKGLRPSVGLHADRTARRVGIIGVLLALLLPGIQQGRAAQRLKTDAREAEHHESQ